MRHGGKILVDQLAIQGARSAFMVPGESFLAVLDALFDPGPVRAVVCRHEGGAAMMAEATGKLTGRPGICFATRGPGAANAVSGVYVAHSDATPMLLFIGLPKRRDFGRGAFQDIDPATLFQGCAKWIAVVDEPALIPGMVARAFMVALSGRPGPVVLGLPEDVLAATADVADAPAAEIAGPVPSPAAMALLAARLARAERPMMIVGGPGWSEEASRRTAEVALRFDLPIAAAFRCQDRLDNRSPCYVGHLGFNADSRLAAGVRCADVLMLAGAEAGEVTTQGFALLGGDDSAQHIVEVHPARQPAGPRAAAAIIAGPAEFSVALASLAPPPRTPPWATFRRDLRSAYEASLRPARTPGAVRLDEIVRHLSDELPDDAIITNGAGNYAQSLHKGFVYKQYGTCLAPQSGSMGYGLPAAIAAKLAHPERTVIALAGDGCFQMTAQELATAVQYDLPVVVIVADNAMHGTIRMHQERTYPGRVIASSLVNPDFAALARCHGAFGETVATTDAFAPALHRALQSGLPAVLDLKLDSEAIAPGQTLHSLGRRH